jgi:hypothetical protein
MTQDQFLRQAFTAIEVNDDYSEAVIRMGDQSGLFFCHRVGERWARATDANGQEKESTVAAQVLSQIAMFRLNAKHLDIQFADGSRWEARFRNSSDRA